SSMQLHPLVDTSRAAMVERWAMPCWKHILRQRPRGSTCANEETWTTSRFKKENNTMAATMIAFYKEPADREKLEKHLFEVHFPLVRKLPGLVKMEVNRFSGKGAPYYLMVTL